MSRRRHNPTDELRRQVRSLSGSGLPQEDIAVIIGCSEKTLRLHYRTELDEGAADANAAVVGFLLRAIQNRNVTAMIFFEKCRGGKKETIREEITRPNVGEVGFGPPPYLPCKYPGPWHRVAANYQEGDELIGPPEGFDDEAQEEKYRSIMRRAGREA